MDSQNTHVIPIDGDMGGEGFVINLTFGFVCSKWLILERFTFEIVALLYLSKNRGTQGTLCHGTMPLNQSGKALRRACLETTFNFVLFTLRHSTSKACVMHKDIQNSLVNIIRWAQIFINMKCICMHNKGLSTTIFLVPCSFYFCSIDQQGGEQNKQEHNSCILTPKK